MTKYTKYSAEEVRREEEIPHIPDYYCFESRGLAHHFIDKIKHMNKELSLQDLMIRAGEFPNIGDYKYPERIIFDAKPEDFRIEVVHSEYRVLLPQKWHVKKD